ncbi:MAG TPA: ferritin family protein [Methylomusa anaerophila]|uniref:Rubrerythrin n=1 Tax=Methylomusa anaerophila TaxID=1930071 RepID=A0A348AIC5_9FIRM|nr:ferritin family protein [Methylomusa anaerophila]BBB90823.1 rubrerythrin [Methylomusa anaerophila]HML90520.1 ferritin family protein [Methylomusa anaerophila]
MNYFSDLEGLRMAVNMEKEGVEFYRQAQDRTSNPEHKLLFGFLMQEELNHAAKFESMYERLKQNKQAGDEEYLFDADVSRYLQTLVETHIFPRNNPFINEPDIANGVLETGWQTQIPGQSNAGQLTTKTILCLALQAEKDSILFYDEMMNNAKFPDAKQIFAELKAEEQSHVEKLQELIRTL